MEEPQHTTADRIVRELLALPSRSTSKSEVHINAGGIGVTVVVCFALVMLTINAMQAGMISDLHRKYDRMQDYLNAIYMQAPHLKPPEKPE